MQQAKNSSSIEEIIEKATDYLKEGEKLCTEAKTNSASTRKKFEEIEIIYPKVNFKTKYLCIQLKMLDTFIENCRDYISGLKLFIKEKHKQKEMITRKIELIFEQLKETQIKHLVTNDKNEEKKEMKNLFDFIDYEGYKIIKNKLISEIESLKGFDIKYNKIYEELLKEKEEIELVFIDKYHSVDLTETGIQYSMEKSTLQEKQIVEMATKLDYLTNSYDSVCDLKNKKEKSKTEYDFLESEKCILSLLHLKKSIFSIKQDAEARFKLYETISLENNEHFNKLKVVESTVVKLTSFSNKIGSNIRDKTNLIENYINEIWTLGNYYEGFIDAYDSFVLELQRRETADKDVENQAQKYNSHLLQMFQSEIHSRNVIFDQLSPYLPGELSSLLGTDPVKYVLLEEGNEDVLNSIK